MYYSLHTDGRENVYLGKERGQNSHIALTTGEFWDIEKDRIQLPYRYTMTVAKGKEPVYYGWYPGANLMQQRLVDVLQAVGVDNLQPFPAEIRRKDNNDEVKGFVTVNIIGSISCAALNESTSMPLATVRYFKDLTIYPNRARGQLMFRLHESPMMVLVHEKVAKAIEQNKFLGLTLTPIAEAPEP